MEERYIELKVESWENFNITDEDYKRIQKEELPELQGRALGELTFSEIIDVTTYLDMVHSDRIAIKKAELKEEYTKNEGGCTAIYNRTIKEYTPEPIIKYHVFRDKEDYWYDNLEEALGCVQEWLEFEDSIQNRIRIMKETYENQEAFENNECKEDTIFSIGEFPC